MVRLRPGRCSGVTRPRGMNNCHRLKREGVWRSVNEGEERSVRSGSVPVRSSASEGGGNQFVAFLFFDVKRGACRSCCSMGQSAVPLLHEVPWYWASGAAVQGL